jgi:hypothetical protein
VNDEPGRRRVVVATEGASAEVELAGALAGVDAMLRRLTDFVADVKDQSGSDALSPGTLWRLSVVADSLLAEVDAMLRRLTEVAVREGDWNGSVQASKQTVRRLGELVEHLQVAFTPPLPGESRNGATAPGKMR